MEIFSVFLLDARLWANVFGKERRFFVGNFAWHLE